MNKWISVKDSLPEEDIEVLIYGNGLIDTGYMTLSENHNLYWINMSNGGELLAEYWMPLTEPSNE